MSNGSLDAIKIQRELMARGEALLRLGRPADAEMIFKSILRQQPRHFDALHLLGIIALQTNRAPQGIELFKRAIKENPANPGPYNDLGVGLQSLRRYKEALASFDKAIALGYQSPEVHNNRGNALRALNLHEQALSSFNRAIALMPRYAVALRNRGMVLREMKRLDEALASYDEAIDIMPDFGEAYRNRGLLLREMNRIDAALQSFDRAIALMPDSAAAHGNRGIVLQDLGRHEEALASFNKSVSLKPADPDENWNQGLCLLLLGEFEQGWRQYEWRKRRQNPIANRSFRQPLWLGKQAVAAKTVFLHWEQGLGDTIQFCRYAPRVRDLGAKVILSVQNPLRGLIQTAFPDVDVVDEHNVPKEFDFHCPLMSLPLAFGTTLETIPSSPRYLHAERASLARWTARLVPEQKPRIGIAWSGSQVHNIQNRSVGLTTLLPLLDIDAQWISLQKEVLTADAELLRANSRILDFSGELSDFADTAALIGALDLVISVDTSVAHLAGALGTPVWILLPFNADWRWLRDRTDSPWYPSARLFRQRVAGDWRDTVADIQSELRSFIRADGTHRRGSA